MPGLDWCRLLQISWPEDADGSRCAASKSWSWWCRNWHLIPD